MKFLVNKPRPIFIAEAFAVFGIFSLYLLEFLGVETFSILSRMNGEVEVPALSFTSVGNQSINISQDALNAMVIVAGIVVVYVILRLGGVFGKQK